MIEQTSLTAARKFNRWLKRTPALSYRTGIWQSANEGKHWTFLEA
jgi:hypothetical protein